MGYAECTKITRIQNFSPKIRREETIWRFACRWQDNIKMALTLTSIRFMHTSRFRNMCHMPLVVP